MAINSQRRLYLDGYFFFIGFFFQYFLLPDDIFCAKNIFSLHLAIMATGSTSPACPTNYLHKLFP